MAKRIRCIGRVQGVFFRNYTKEEADKLGLNGWVTNELDGSVTIVAEGEESAINHLIAWSHNGPEMARVERVEVSTEEDHGYDKFEIRR